jgi:hypothetical protein
MSDAADREPQTGAEEGVFGKLPRSRPGTRSPRRAGGEGAGAPPRSAAVPPKRAEPPRPRRAATKAAPAMPPSARDREAPPSRGVEREPEGEEASGGAGLEDLAWAGIAVSAEAATLGVRLVSRAIDAARKAAERR